MGAGEPHAKSKQEHIGGGHPLRSFCFCLLFFWFKGKIPDLCLLKLVSGSKISVGYSSSD